MQKVRNNKIRVSVRNLVEFIYRTGDIDNRQGKPMDTDRMLQGGRIHRRIQQSMPEDYAPEVPLSYSRVCNGYTLIVEGRADGVFTQDDFTWIDEIKGVDRDLKKIEKPEPLHLYQAKCYAYMLQCMDPPREAGVQITYAQLKGPDILRFRETYTWEVLESWFTELLDQYQKWSDFCFEHREKRNEQLKAASFPFEYRPGQKTLAAAVYRSIESENYIFLQAPTGVGKTMSVLYPSFKACGEDRADKLFYLTAKTITRTVAFESCRIVSEQAKDLSAICITAKEKICSEKVCDCNPENCPRAMGHFDRVNAAVWALIHEEQLVSPEIIAEYARRFSVCPYELSLDVSEWVDCVICDYNYLFDPNVSFCRYFGENPSGRFVFLIDEAHNLADRARDMYSAVLYKEDFLALSRYAKRQMGQKDISELKTVIRKALKLNKLFLARRKDWEHADKWLYLEDVSDIYATLEELMFALNDWMDSPHYRKDDEYLEIYFRIRDFINVCSGLDDAYRIYCMEDGKGQFFIRLYCINPASNIVHCLESGVAAVFFSATLLPVNYYKNLYIGNEQSPALYINSPFSQSNRCLLAATDVSSKYRRRTQDEFEKYRESIQQMISAKAGSYMVFFPSYDMMNRICCEEFELMMNMYNIRILKQSSGMKEDERVAFLEAFRSREEGSTVVGMCVLGGIFSEGIDLTGESLIGVMIVGTGLPQVCAEREIIREYFGPDKGFDYAYLYPGMNKVQQAAGRVIRTDTDRGVICLMDERFCNREYTSLFPVEWNDCLRVSFKDLGEMLGNFWENNN